MNFYREVEWGWGKEVLFEKVMAMNFLKLRENINTQIREGLQTPSRIKTKQNKTTPRHVIIQMLTIEDTL